MRIIEDGDWPERERVEALRSEAAGAGDWEMVASCDDCLDGEWAAALVVWRVLMEAEAHAME